MYAYLDLHYNKIINYKGQKSIFSVGKPYNTLWSSIQSEHLQGVAGKSLVSFDVLLPKMSNLNPTATAKLRDTKWNNCNIRKYQGGRSHGKLQVEGG